MEPEKGAYIQNRVYQVAPQDTACLKENIFLLIIHTLLVPAQ